MRTKALNYIFQTRNIRLLFIFFSIPFLFCFSQSQVFAEALFQAMITVPAVETQFQNLKHHGEALAWRNPEYLGAPDASGTDHYQGVVRYPGEGIPVLYITHRDNDDPPVPPAVDHGGYLHVVVLGSRDTTGERLRSNLLEKNKATADTLPSENDTWVNKTRFDGTLSVDGNNLPAYEHPGGTAIVDNILFVPLDTPSDEGADPTPATGYIILFDLSGPSTDTNGNGVPDCRENPTPIQAIELDHSIDNLAVIKQEDGTYLVWVNGNGGEDVRLYRTNVTDLRNNQLSLTLVQVWNPDLPTHYDGNGDSWPTGTGAHQCSAFILQSDGILYMLGMRHPGGLPDVGSDYADLYRVDIDQNAGGVFKLVHISTRLLYCSFDLGNLTATRICNFSAANNAYISPSGQLILYSMPHGDEESVVDIVWMAEFRNWNINDDEECGNVPCGPWAEFYDDDNFEDRSIVFEWPDRAKDDFNDLELHDGFGDKASSVRWCVPVGCSIILYEDNNYGGSALILPPSNGTVMEMPDLGGWGNKISSIQFSGNCTPNAPPVIDIGEDLEILELDIFTRMGSFTDTDNVSWTATVDYGDGPGKEPLILEKDNTFLLNHIYTQEGLYTLKVEITDANENTGKGEIQVTVKKRLNFINNYLLLLF